MTTFKSFRHTADYAAIFMVAFGIVYLFFGEGFQAFRDSKATNYGQPVVYGHNMYVDVPTTLGHSRIIANNTVDLYADGKHRLSYISLNQMSFHHITNHGTTMSKWRKKSSMHLK
jgi:hypothetical protein